MELIRFPEPPLLGAYLLADGNYSHWILPHWAAFWRLVFTQALKSMGAPAAIPPHVFDCSTEDADTPEGHPGNAHDGGDDLDIGYAMTSNNNFNIGPIRWVQLGRNQKAPQLATAPTVLDTRYQAAIFAHAAILDREWGGLIQNIAVDPKAEEPLETAISANDLHEETKRTARNLLNSSRDVSWIYWHANHYHVRHYLRRDADELEREFRSRLNAIVAPVVVVPAPMTVEERLLRCEKALGLA
jgi:hypothetical protein